MFIAELCCEPELTTNLSLSQSTDIEFRHELMNRLNKLDTDVELELHPNQQQQQQQSGSPVVYGSYENYGTVKEYYCGTTKREISADNDDQFLRPPLWEDITSSIQNIDPENAIMLSALTGATQVKLESSDDTFLESLSSPLLSPLEIKTEKGFYQPNHNNNSIHLQPGHINHVSANGDSYSVQHFHQNNSNPQVHSNQLNGYQDFNMHHQQYSNNYYNWQQNHPQSHQPPVYANKYVPQCAPPMSRLMYVPPLTPPSSDPGSPGNSVQVSSKKACRATLPTLALQLRFCFKFNNFFADFFKTSRISKKNKIRNF